MSWSATFVKRLQSVLKSLRQQLAALWPPRKRRIFRHVNVDESPSKFDAATIYIAGESNNLWAAFMICPCGCGEVIELNLLKQVRPCWTVQEHSDRTISLAPSIWRQKGCRSHFFFHHGRIEWC